MNRTFILISFFLLQRLNEEEEEDSFIRSFVFPPLLFLSLSLFYIDQLRLSVYLELNNDDVGVSVYMCVYVFLYVTDRIEQCSLCEYQRNEAHTANFR